MKEQNPILICNSGLSMSIQASKFHYCSPRNDKGPYTSVEIGFPSMVVPEILDYAEDFNNPTGTVYAYVPVELVLQVIENNGGVDFEAMGVDTFPELITETSGSL